MKVVNHPLGGIWKRSTYEPGCLTAEFHNGRRLRFDDGISSSGYQRVRVAENDDAWVPLAQARGTLGASYQRFPELEIVRPNVDPGRYGYESVKQKVFHDGSMRFEYGYFTPSTWQPRLFVEMGPRGELPEGCSFNADESLLKLPRPWLGNVTRMTVPLPPSQLRLKEPIGPDMGEMVEQLGYLTASPKADWKPKIGEILEPPPYYTTERFSRTGRPGT